MNINLEKQDIVNLLAALNALQVGGKEAHQTAPYYYIKEVQDDYD